MSIFDNFHGSSIKAISSIFKSHKVSSPASIKLLALALFPIFVALTKKQGIMVSLTQFLFLGPIGAWEVFLLLTVILIFFGAKKIPELARGLGKGIREFKDASSEVTKSLEEGMKDKKEDNKS